MAYKVNVQEASLKMTAALDELGLLEEKEKIWLIHRIKAGDHSGYRDLKRKLVRLSDLIGRM